MNETAAAFHTSYNQPLTSYKREIGIPYATFGKRVAASLIDFVIELVFVSIFIAIFLQDSFDSGTVRFWGFLFGIAYKAGMESSAYQGTIGKIALGLKVVDAHGQRISFPRSLGRYFASFLSGMILGIGYLLSLFTEKRQTLHDIIAGTFVYKK